METAVSDRGIVAAPHWLAVESGLAALRDGANAFEAAVAAAATLAVVYPHMNGIGGDILAMVREEGGRTLAVQACGAAGSLASLRRYREKGFEAMPARGADAAATVAGAVSGWSALLDLARAAGGRIPVGVLLQDATQLARTGFPVSPAQARTAPSDLADIAAAPGFAAHFTTDGKPLAEGAAFVQPRLADTLEHLARAGLDDFYRGDVSRELAADLAGIDAPVTRDDLARHEARPREPLRLRLRDGTVYVPPPPSQAVTQLLILGMAEHLDLVGPDAAAFVHGMVEAVKRAYLTRDAIVGDPADGLPDPALSLAPDRLKREAARIDMQRAAPHPALSEGDTVWFGVVDGRGRAVSICQSVFAAWGSGCVLPSTGVLWHNRGASFTLEPGLLRTLKPGRLPFHTLSPALADFPDGRTMSFGTMGGDSQPQTVAALYTRYVRFGQSLSAAIDAPRWRFGQAAGEPGRTLKLEPRFDPSLVAALRRMGHEVVDFASPYADDAGHAGMIVRHPSGRIEGVHDPRADGGAGAA